MTFSVNHDQKSKISSLLDTRIGNHRQAVPANVNKPEELRGLFDRQTVDHLYRIQAEETEHLAKLGITMNRSRDYASLRKFAERRAKLFNPTFDPNHRKPGNEDYWCRFIDSDGITMGSMAFAVFDDVDFEELVRSGKLWYDNPPADWRQTHFPKPLQISAMGRVLHTGSLAISHKYNAKATAVGNEHLSSHVVRLARVDFLLNNYADIWTGFYMGRLAAKGVLEKVHRINSSRLVPICKGYMPQFGVDDTLLATEFTMDEVARSIIAKDPANRISADAQSVTEAG